MWRLVISSSFCLNLQVRKCMFQPCHIMTDSVLSSVIRKQMLMFIPPLEGRTLVTVVKSAVFNEERETPKVIERGNGGA